MSDHRIFELRRYRLCHGAREALLELFDREFVEPQLDAGMAIPGEYIDDDDPDAFVWFRSFPDMTARAKALRAFYGGPVWAAWGGAANATMLNSDNVLLMRPATPAIPFPAALPRTPPPGAAVPTGLVTISTCSLAPNREADFAKFFTAEAQPLLSDLGARIDAVFVTERSANTFPRLPVREGETVLVWVSAFESDAAYQAHLDRLASCAAWRELTHPRLDRQLWRALETARLRPTARSRHRW